MGYIVVVSPVAVDGAGGFLNVNADTAASAIAVALEAERMVFLTDVEGIRGSDGTMARQLDPDEAHAWIEDGVISGGMIPKAEACLQALAGTQGAQIVDGRRAHVLLEALAEPNHIGTTFTPRARARR
jgi:acetylglutamate kinase